MIFRQPSTQLSMQKLLVLAVAGFVCSTSALDIKAGDLGDSKAGDHQPYEKKWTINPSDTGKEVLAVKLDVPGRVYVGLAKDGEISNGGVASVRVSGDSKDLLQAFTVVLDDDDDKDDSKDNKSDEFKVRLVKDKAVKTKGYVYTEVLLANKAQLETLKTAGTAQVIIGDDVFISGTNAREGFEIKSSGTGDVYWTTKSTMSAKSFSIDASGTGSVFVSTDKLSLAKELEISAQGTGNVYVMAGSVTAAETDVDAKGTGNICVKTTSDFSITSLKVDASGMGNTQFATKSSTSACKSAKIESEGTGKVDVGSVACAMVDVKQSGMGNVIVQASDTLAVSGKNGVQYTGTKPKTIKPGNDAATEAKDAGDNKACSTQVPATPGRGPIEVEVEITSNGQTSIKTNGNTNSNGAGDKNTAGGNGNTSGGSKSNNNSNSPKSAAATTGATALVATAAAAVLSFFL